MSQPPQADFSTRISHAYADLSPSARAIADFLQQQPLAVLSLSVADIADKVHTSKASVSRFFRQLGYHSQQQARQDILQQRQEGLPIAQASDASALEQELSHLQLTFKQLDIQQVMRIANSIVKAKRVIIFGARTSYPIAMSMCQQLKQIRSQIELIPHPGQSLSETLVDIGEHDLVIVFGFRRRPKVFKALLASLANKNCVLLTDSSGQLYQSSVKELIICQLGQLQAFDSYAAPMAVVSLICNQAYQLIDSHGQSRSHVISKLYKQLDELS